MPGRLYVEHIGDRKQAQNRTRIRRRVVEAGGGVVDCDGLGCGPGEARTLTAHPPQLAPGWMWLKGEARAQRVQDVGFDAVHGLRVGLFVRARGDDRRPAPPEADRAA